MVIESISWHSLFINLSRLARVEELFNNVICADNSFRRGSRGKSIYFISHRPECFHLIGFSVCIVVGLRAAREKEGGFGCYLLLKEMCLILSSFIWSSLAQQQKLFHHQEVIIIMKVPSCLWALLP